MSDRTRTGSASARQPVPISMQIYRQLREEIITLVRPPGSPLSDKELSMRLGVSRTPAREAFIKLAEEGMITVLPSSGTFVTKIRPDALRNAHFVRRALEEASIEDAAGRVSPADIEALRHIVGAQEARIGEADRSEFYRLDETFHRTLFEIAGHSEAWPIVDKVKAQLDRVRYLSLSYEHRQEEVVGEHTNVVDALATGDDGAARALLAEHLRCSFRSIERAITIYGSYFEHASPPAPAAARSRRRTPAKRRRDGSG